MKRGIKKFIFYTIFESFSSSMAFSKKLSLVGVDGGVAVTSFILWLAFKISEYTENNEK